jgi:hypothetical protein
MDKNKFSLNGLIGPTGGLTYHYRALRYKKLWQPFCDQVERWLSEWSPQKNQLVLIGPSAGYTLPREFLATFNQLIIVDPDPAAFLLFQSRFTLPAVWLREDFFGLAAKVASPAKINELFARFPQAAFLFCNILGQVPVILRERKYAQIEEYMRDLGTELRAAQSRVSMASYHDRYSQTKKTPGEIIDHLTGELFRDLPGRKEFPWQLTPQIEHQVEFWHN